MNKVHQLYPEKVEGIDGLGNPFEIYLIGFMPTGLDRLGQLPNLYLHDANTNYHFFIRLEFVGDVEATRKKLTHYDHEIIVNMYTDLIAAYVRRAGIHIPEGALIADVGQLMRVFAATGVTHSFGWLYRGTSQSFIFEVGVVFFHVYEGVATKQSFCVMVNDVRHQCEVLASPTKLQLDPWTLFEIKPQLFTQLQDWFNDTVNKSPYVKATFKIPH